MNLLEYEGKALLRRYGIPVPAGRLITPRATTPPRTLPVVIKSQVPVGDRKQKGGIVFARTATVYRRAVTALGQRTIDGHLPRKLLVEPVIAYAAERYVSLSYDTALRQPVLALNATGGTGIAAVTLTPIDLRWGLDDFLIRQALAAAGLPPSRALAKIVADLWRLFSEEQALLVEINPLFERADGTYLAGDAKIILDDNVVRPEWRPYVELPGDIAVLASGGGASMINLDALLHFGGRPANYVEYSGNPKSDVVKKLTQRVLSKPGLRGCWVVGGTANFTDIYETMRGFVAGLTRVRPKPTYPIVIRRDGPRQAEAFAMLKDIGQQHGFNFHLFGPELPMSQSAKIMVQLAYGTGRKRRV